MQRHGHTTKGAFFHYFRGKDELGIELLKHFRESGRAALAGSRGAGERDPRRRLRRYLAHLEALYASDPRFRDGCLYAIFACGNAEPRSEVRRLCAAAIDEWLEAAADEFKAVFSMLRVRPAVRPRELAHFRRYAESLIGARGRSRIDLRRLCF